MKWLQWFCLGCHQTMQCMTLSNHYCIHQMKRFWQRIIGKGFLCLHYVGNVGKLHICRLDSVSVLLYVRLDYLSLCFSILKSWSGNYSTIYGSKVSWDGCGLVVVGNWKFVGLIPKCKAWDTIIVVSCSQSFDE